MQILNISMLTGKPLQRRRTHKIMKTLPYHGKVNNTQQYTIVQSHFATSHHILHGIVILRYQCFGI